MQFIDAEALYGAINFSSVTETGEVGIASSSGLRCVVQPYQVNNIRINCDCVKPKSLKGVSHCLKFQEFICPDQRIELFYD